MKKYKRNIIESNIIIKNKQDLIDFVKHQLNIELINDPKNRLNSKQNVLYTQISDRDAYSVLPLLRKKGLRYEKHRSYGEDYWIWIK